MKHPGDQPGDMGDEMGASRNGQRAGVEHHRKSLVSYLACIVLVGCMSPSSIAVAAEEDRQVDESESSAVDGPPVGLEPSPMDVLFPDTRSRHMSFGITTQRFSPSQEAMSTVYPDAPWRLGLALGLFPFHRVHPVVEVSGMKLIGAAVGQFSGEASEEITTMLILPVEASVQYLFDYSWEQILVPYVGVGGDAYVWKETSPEATTSGVKWGVHGTAGLLLRLNFMETTTHWSSGGTLLPSDAGVSAHVTYAWVDSFGRQGLDFSGWQFGVGGMIAF